MAGLTRFGFNATRLRGEYVASETAMLSTFLVNEWLPGIRASRGPESPFGEVHPSGDSPSDAGCDEVDVADQRPTPGGNRSRPPYPPNTTHCWAHQQPIHRAPTLDTAHPLMDADSVRIRVYGTRTSRPITKPARTRSWNSSAWSSGPVWSTKGVMAPRAARSTTVLSSSTDTLRDPRISHSFR